jgi:hypothetical protein
MEEGDGPLPSVENNNAKERNIRKRPCRIALWPAALVVTIRLPRVNINKSLVMASTVLPGRVLGMLNKPTSGATPYLPKSYWDAIKQPDYKEQWHPALSTQVKSLEDKETWELVKLPPGEVALGEQWILDQKLTSLGLLLATAHVGLSAAIKKRVWLMPMIYTRQ